MLSTPAVDEFGFYILASLLGTVAEILVASFGSGPSTTFYPWRRPERRSPNAAFIALARKLLAILNAMVRDGTMWRQAAR